MEKKIKIKTEGGGELTIKMKDGIDGIPGKDGINGKSPTEKELISIIKPLIPVFKQPKDGINGKDGKDSKSTEVIKEVLLRIPKVKDGINGKDGSPDKPKDIRDKLESLKGENRLDISAIKGVKELKKEIKDNESNLLWVNNNAIKSVVAGNNISIDNTDAQNPIISSAGGGNSPLTTKGDLYTYSTTNTRFPVGTNTQVLSSDSSTITGLKWIDTSTIVPYLAEQQIAFGGSGDLMTSDNNFYYNNNVFSGTREFGVAFDNNFVVRFQYDLQHYAFGDVSNSAGSTKLIMDDSAQEMLLYAASGTKIVTTPTTSVGTYEFLTRNSSTGEIEKVGDNKLLFDGTTNKLSNLADYGSELAPALTSGNWTTTSGWTVDTSPDVLNHGTDGTGFITPSASTFVVAGTRYKITIAMTVTAGSFSVSIGANPNNAIAFPGNNEIKTSGTYTFYLTAYDTTKFQVIPVGFTSRGKVTALSIMAVTDETGNALFEGDTTHHNIITNGTLASARQRFVVQSDIHNVSFGNGVMWLEVVMVSSYKITGIVSTLGDGEWMYITNVTGQPLILSHQDPNSTDINRLISNSGANMYLYNGEMAVLQYAGGNTNRWNVRKISNNALALNGSSSLDSILGQYLINSGDMTIGGGVSMVDIDASSGITAIGDVQNTSNGTRIEVNDTAQTITDNFRISKGSVDLTGSYIMEEFAVGDGNFNTRTYWIDANFLINDELGSVASPIDPSALFEVRSTGADMFRGWLMPRMQASERDGITTPAQGLQVYVNDTPGISTFENSVWVTQYTTAFTQATLPAGVQGSRAWITDELVGVFGGVATGGGAIVVPVFYDGTNWIVG